MTKRFKKSISLILCVLMVFSAFVPVFGATPSTDYESHWAKEAIASAITSGISKGYPDGSFKPDNAITRAEFFALVNSSFKFTAATEATYTDVAATAWYAPVIAQAKAADYISGYTDGSIHPESNITRQEAAMIISRLKSLTAVSSTLSFTDAPSIADWSKKAVMAAFEAKVMSGYPDGSFRPAAPIKRAEALVAVKNSFAYQTAAKPVDAVKSTDTVYDKAGAYGSATETVTVEGNVVIKAAGVTLQNTIVKGNLTIAKEVGKGDVTLKSVIVKGNTYVNGGGENSVYFVNVTTGKVYVLKDDGPVRIVASGTSEIDELLAGSDVKLEEVNMTGKGFEGVSVEKNAAGGIDITLTGVKCDSIDIKAAGVTLNADKNSTVTSLKVDAAGTQIKGTGKIESAVINAGGVNFETKPVKTETAAGITAPTVNPPATGGGGGGGGGGTTPVTVPSLTVGAQNGNLYQTTDGTATFTVTTANIANGQPGVITLFEANQQTPADSFAAIKISCSNVLNNTAAIRVTGSHASPGTYYFKVTINGVTSSMISLVVNPSTAENCFTFEAATKTITAYSVSTGGLNVVVPIMISGTFVEKIGASAFDNKGLTSVILPSTVAQIGDDAFAHNNLTGVIIPNGVTSIGERAFWMNKLASVTIPNSVTRLGVEAFRENELITVSIGTGVPELPARVFASNKLTVVTIPENIRIIYTGAFIDNQLTQITIGSKVQLDMYLLTSTGNSFKDAYNAQQGDPGTYVGTQTGAWTKVGAVSSINVSGAGDATAISADNGTLQMSAAVLPANATNPAVTWSVANGSGTATISASGLLTALTDGTVTVKATSVSSPSKSGTAVITLSNQFKNITLLAIAGITAPVKGAAPVTTPLDTEQYSGTVSWTPASNPFTGGISYKANIVLTAKSGWSLNGVAANTFTVNGAVVTHAADAGAISAVFPATLLAIGDSFGGGQVAYILQSGDSGYEAGVQHGLIAAAADQSNGIIWATAGATPDNQKTLVSTSNDIGTGQANTNKIIAQNGLGNTYAAGLCNDFSVEVDGVTYSDWYLPSKDELRALYLNRALISGFPSNGGYWSSTEVLGFKDPQAPDVNYDGWYAYVEIFADGVFGANYPKVSPAPGVRAIRSF